MTTVRAIFIASLISLGAAAEAQVQVPNTFTAGTPAKAAEVNANFAYLAGQVAAAQAGPPLYATKACQPDCILPASLIFPNPDAYTTLATLTLPAGSYLVIARLNGYVLGQINGFNFECILKDGANVAVADYSSMGGVGEGVIHFQLPMAFTGGGGSAVLGCRVAVFGAVSTVEPHAWGASVIALQVGVIHQ